MVLFPLNFVQIAILNIENMPNDRLQSRSRTMIIKSITKGREIRPLALCGMSPSIKWTESSAVNFVSHEIMAMHRGRYTHIPDDVQRANFFTTLKTEREVMVQTGDQFEPLFS
jgi:hypothetical protein